MLFRGDVGPRKAAPMDIWVLIHPGFKQVQLKLFKTKKIIAKDCLLTLVRSRRVLGSPGWLVVRSFVPMPKKLNTLKNNC